MTENGRMEKRMGKELPLTQMEETILENIKMRKGMGKEHTLCLMEESMSGITRMG